MHGHRHRHRKRTQTQTQTRKRTHTHHNTIVFAYRQNASTGLARAAPQTAHTTRGPTAWCWSGAVHIAQTAAPGAFARPHVVQLSPTTPAAARATGRGPDHGCVMAAQSVGSHLPAGPFNHCAHVMTRGTSFAPTKAAFGALTRAAAAKHTKHAPAAVITVIFSAGGGLRACDDELLPCPEDRNGRH
jgi:hypothetical protein